MDSDQLKCIIRFSSRIIHLCINVASDKQSGKNDAMLLFAAKLRFDQQYSQFFYNLCSQIKVDVINF